MEFRWQLLCISGEASTGAYKQAIHMLGGTLRGQKEMLLLRVCVSILAVLRRRLQCNIIEATSRTETKCVVVLTAIHHYSWLTLKRGGKP